MILTDSDKIVLRQCNATRKQIRTIIRYIKYYSRQRPVLDCGFGCEWIGLAYPFIYIGVERNGYAHS